jgi:hypothetical protein
MRWIHVLALVGVGLLSMQCGQEAHADFIFADDFNRPNGVVGNGWTTFHGSSIGSTNIQIKNGQLQTLGSPNLAGGIFRELPIALSAGPIEFEFQFRTDDPANGGWWIGFNSSASGASPFA